MALPDAATGPKRNRATARGFTLIELLIAVAIVAILAAIALPSYERYVRKARRTDAKQALLDYAARQEKYFSTNNQYQTDATKIGYSASNDIAINNGSTSYYTLHFDVPTATTFSATATPINAQAADECQAYQLDHLGAQTNPGVNDASLQCW